MAKEKTRGQKYWELEQGETVEFGNCFMRCFDKAGKLQFGVKFRDNRTGEWVYAVKFVLDREDLCSDFQAATYLRATIEEWEEKFENAKSEEDEVDDD